MRPIIGDDPFEKTEEDLIKEYNSSQYVPQIVFLGLDEKHEGFVYKDWYKGQPWFAVDVTPTKSVTEAAEKLIAELTGRGLEFSKGRMHLSLPAQEGGFFFPSTSIAANYVQPPSTPKRDICWIGMRGIPTARLVATRQCP